MNNNAYPRVIDLSKPIPADYRCIKCGRLEWRLARKWQQREAG